MFINSIIDEDKILVGDITAWVIKPKNVEEKLPVIFYYHGWSSRKDNHLNIGRLLACNGYIVVLADAINHGERGNVNYTDLNTIVRCFWPTIENNLKEFPVLLNYIKESYNIDESRIGVTGHSMGAITTSGLIATYSNIIKTGVTMNGSGSWKSLSTELLNNFNNKVNDELNEALSQIDKISPVNNIDRFVDKPILIMHGECDQVVPISSDKAFYNKLKEKYTNKDAAQLITHEKLNHFVTEAYINEMINWFNKYL